MLSLITSSADTAQIVAWIFAFLVIMLVSMPLNMYVQGLAAALLGDDTPERSGRLTLNPMAHFDITGAIAMLLCGIGWGKPMPINVSKCSKVRPKAAMLITALVGPVANILIAYISVIIQQSVFYCNIELILSGKESMEYYIFMAFMYVAYLNVYLAVINLLPIPPFSGARILAALLPLNLYMKIAKYERIIGLVVMVMLLFGILSMPIAFLSGLVMDGLVNASGFVKMFFV